MLNNLSRTLNDGPLRYGIRNTPVEVSKSRQSVKFQHPHPVGNRRRNATKCCTTRCADTSPAVPHSPSGIQPLPLHHTQPKNTGIQQDASSPHPLQNSHTVAQTQHLYPPQSPKPSGKRCLNRLRRHRGCHPRIHRQHHSHVLMLQRMTVKHKRTTERTEVQQ